MKRTSFASARPVWARGLLREQNVTLRFTASGKGASALRLAGSASFQVFADGKLILSGPARAGHGYRRVDEIALPACESVEILVAGYNVNSFYLVDEPPFLCAELLAEDGTVLAATGGEGFCVRRVNARIQKVQRYSFQRPFVEVYDMRLPDGDPLETEDAPAGIFLQREVPVPEYEETEFASAVSVGTFDFGETSVQYTDRALTNINEKLKGFPKDTLEVCLSDEMCAVRTISRAEEKKPGAGLTLEGMQYAILDLGAELTGYVALEIETEGGRLYAGFDEILLDGDVSFKRFGACNAIRWDLPRGTHTLLSFEPYSMRYLKLLAADKMTVRRAWLIRYEYPSAPLCEKPATADVVLSKIYDAAVSTFRQNTVDVFMDCPSRERAGWLCDSFFTARVEYALTGKTTVERAFLENFLMPDSFAFLPKGMLPMCYPSDHNDGNFIPNWAMWYVIELEEYIFDRGGDRSVAEWAKGKLYDLLAYFAPFENEDGLLSSLKGWVFVEWSRSNQLTQDISFPSNMLYARMLRAMAHLYGDAALKEKADALTAVIRQKSFTGQWFCDNAVYNEEGIPVLSGECTESCQYYAFFTGIANPILYPALWETMVRDFGPERKETKLHPEIAYSNAFIGNYLRLELLWKAGLREKTIENVRGYFGFMADRTGTLWENDAPHASCNHGFASHTAIWIKEYV